MQTHSANYCFPICVRFDSSLFTKLASHAGVNWGHVICSVIFLFAYFEFLFKFSRAYIYSKATFTLVMLNKLRCHAHFQFQPIRLLDPGCWYKFNYWMANSAYPDQFRRQLIWIYKLFAKAGISGFSRTRVKQVYWLLFLVGLLIIYWSDYHDAKLENETKWNLLQDSTQDFGALVYLSASLQ